jgi:hypothetical protein
MAAGPEVLSPLWERLHTRSTGVVAAPQSRTPTWRFGRDGNGRSAFSARFEAILKTKSGDGLLELFADRVEAVRF